MLEAESDVGGYRILRAAQQAPDGFAIMFSLEIPERDIDGAHGRAPHAGLGARIELAPKLIPDTFGLERILAAQKRRRFPVDKFANSETLRATR